MAAKRKALGKGLSALIPEDLEKEDYERIREIDIDLISPIQTNPAGFLSRINWMSLPSP